MAKWFGARYNQDVRFSPAVKCKKGPQVLTSLHNKRRNYYYKNSKKVWQPDNIIDVMYKHSSFRRSILINGESRFFPKSADVSC